MRAPIRGRAFASFLLWPSFALAALTSGEGSEEPSSRKLETVVVTATRSKESILDVTEAITAIDAEEVARLAPELLAEMLRGVPGAFFQQTTPGQGIPIIRGLKGSQVLHLVDGMRLNNAFFRNAPNQYLGLVDAYAAQRMEIIRGAAPSLHGADAMGGVLQVLTSEPDFDSGDWTGRGRIFGSYDSVDAGIVGRAEAAAGREGQAWSGGVTYQDHGDRRVGGGDKVAPSAYEVRAADLKWRYRTASRSELMLSAQYLDQPSTPRVDELVPGFGQAHPSSERYEFMPNRREFLHARYRLQGRAAWFSQFEAHLGRQVITDDRLTQDFGSAEVARESNESTLDGLTLQVNSEWAADSELVWGFEYYDDRIRSQRQRTDTASGETREVRSRFPDRSAMESAAVYAANHWRRGPFRVSAGLRYSWFEIVLPRSEEFDAMRLSPSDLTGDVHLNVEVQPGIHIVSNIGRGFRPPNIFDLGTLGSRPGNRFNVPNPDLNPESVWSYDLGVKLSTGRWEAEAYAWYSDYRDKISSRFTGETTPDGRQVVRSDNLNSVTLHGIESGLRYRARDGLELYAVVNYTHGEEDDGLKTVPADRIPPLNGRLGLIYRPGERMRLETFLDYASRQDRLSPRDEDDPRIDPQGTSGWGTLNVLLSWRFSEAMEVGLRAQNLTDESYREHGSGLDAPGRSLGAWFDYRF